MARFKALTVAGFVVAVPSGIAGPKHASPDDALVQTLREHAGEQRFDSQKPLQLDLTIDGFAPGEQDPGGGYWPYGQIDVKQPAIVISADATAAWITADLDVHAMFQDGTPNYVSPIVAHAHGVLLADLAVDSRPTAVAANVGVMVDAKTAAKAVEPAPLEASASSDAQAAVERFRGSLGDPAKLVATLSARKDVTLLGSAPGERYTGAAVRTKLAHWGLAFTIRDGVRAGVTKSKTVAWVAATLDARPAKSPKASPTPYRALFIYEQTGSAWQLVHLSFSMIDPNIREHH